MEAAPNDSGKDEQGKYDGDDIQVFMYLLHDFSSPAEAYSESAFVSMRWCLLMDGVGIVI